MFLHLYGQRAFAQGYGEVNTPVKKQEVEKSSKKCFVLR